MTRSYMHYMYTYTYVYVCMHVHTRNSNMCVVAFDLRSALIYKRFKHLMMRLKETAFFYLFRVVLILHLAYVDTTAQRRIKIIFSISLYKPLDGDLKTIRFPRLYAYKPA